MEHKAQQAYKESKVSRVLMEQTEHKAQQAYKVFKV